MSLLGTLYYKVNDNASNWIEASDSHMPEITGLLKDKPNTGVAFKLTINAQNQTYKNIGVYLTPVSNLGDWRYEPTGAVDSNKNALLEFDDGAGLYIYRASGDAAPAEAWEKFENGDLDADPQILPKGRDYGNRIRIGRDFDTHDTVNTTYGNARQITFKLKFVPEAGAANSQPNSRRWDRIFVGLEFEGEIHNGNS
jgi:hypothetical protein